MLSLFSISAASANSFASEAFGACASEQAAVDVGQALEAIGWRLAERSIPLPARAVLRDGILAAMHTDHEVPIDWSATALAASRYLANLTYPYQSGEQAILLVAGENEAVLAVSNDLEAPGFNGIHCIFGGPADESFSFLFEQGLQMQTTAGIGQASQGLEIVTLRRLQDDDLGRETVFDTQMGRFTEAFIEEVGREFAAEVGFSLIYYVER
ncbi:MAG: hypothetical protein AAF689_00885 [Pseudomonadota bacterium]